MASEVVLSIESLLLSVAGGDRQAFRRLYEATKDKLYGVCLSMLRDRERANDVSQEVFIKIWEKAALYDPAKGDAVSWMVTLARRCVLDEVRRKGAPAVALDEIDPDSAVLTIAPLFAAAESGRDLRRCLDRLQPEQARSIILAFVYGLTHEELARKMGKPLGTVKSWVRRGLADLKDCLAHEP
jgi:RNA polymerase sigma-70 factor, ECF subfamily